MGRGAEDALSAIVGIRAELRTVSGGREGSHPPVPTDPYVSLSVDTAVVILVIRPTDLDRLPQD
jgi:hypothetical protein